MGLMSILTRGTSLNLPNPKPNNSLSRRTLKKRACTINVPTTSIFVSQVFKPSIFRIRSLQREDAGNYEAATDSLDVQHGSDDQACRDLKDKANAMGSPFLLILVLALGAAAIISVVSVTVKWRSSESFFGIQCLAESSQSSVKAAAPAGFTLKALGYRIVLPEYAPGWIYFWLLMAAGCGLFISEEALNIWVCPLYWLE
uniref:Uncharacterized protein LOC105644392 isoform X2 n=1 Tax=Rhizophora mucronata TaxID=61149 RepID=A0A2P2LA53_RHIMU